MGTAAEAAAQAARFLAGRRMLIDGEWVEARLGRTLEVCDPATGDVIDHVTAGDGEDVELVVIAARRGLEDSRWSPMTASSDPRTHTQTKTVCIGL